MIERAFSAVDERLDAIVGVIVAALAPSRIILFGSRARGDGHPDSDYDLAIEVAFDAAEGERIKTRVLRLVRAAVPDTPVDVALRQPGQIESRRDDPGFMDWDIARDGVIIYPLGGGRSASRQLRGDAVREARPSMSVAAWLARAEEDRRAVENILAAAPDASWTAVCFHSQQLAEKYLKVLLIEAGERPPRTRDLLDLVARARRSGYALPDLESACETLREFAVAVRYPDDVAIPSESRAREAWTAAQRIVKAVESLRPTAR